MQRKEIRILFCPQAMDIIWNWNCNTYDTYPFLGQPVNCRNLDWVRISCYKTHIENHTLSKYSLFTGSLDHFSPLPVGDDDPTTRSIDSVGLLWNDLPLDGIIEISNRKIWNSTRIILRSHFWFLRETILKLQTPKFWNLAGRWFRVSHGRAKLEKSETRRE